MDSMPEAVLIAGANGAGKTTFARAWLRMRRDGAIFLNADEIQREGGKLSNPVAAGREVLGRLDELVRHRTSFTIETTLASRNHVARVEAWSEVGYRTTLHFIELPSADYAVERVARRVAAGGHDIPDADIRRRFARGIEMFAGVYRSAVDRSCHWRSDDQGLELVAPTGAHSDQELDQVREAAQRATRDALHGPARLRSGRFFLE